MVRTLPFADLQVPVPGFGAMGLNSSMGTDFNFEQSEPVLMKPLSSAAPFGILPLVAYKNGENEKLIGEFVKKHNVRDKVFVASKCGFDVFGPERKVTNSAAHIREYIEGTIERLGFTPDLYYLHRIDPSTHPARESIGALDELRRAGKTKNIGLSECSAATLRKANAIAKIDAVQAEYSAFETLHETAGLIETAKELGVAFVAFSPLGHGWLVDNFDYKSPEDFARTDFRTTVPKFQGENFYKNKAIVDEIKKLAVQKGCSVAQIALAWVAAQGLITIPGTTKASRLTENWASRDIELTREEMNQMREIVDAAKPVGERFAPIFQSMVGH
ncbi:Putative Aldo-keto reductase yakc [NADP ] [Aspergillus calidoustus]|uniref:Putative Aldo-keto reductase yakc [NADP ] n=1 Tax=Aspergillus calidoustus TaxID=454130 RepID=A0A0U5G5V7_ASPCI|nr:Putative Aldo-keto reductase yakc [NADP ] [Aspergillus calidoustus]